MSEQGQGGGAQQGQRSRKSYTVAITGAVNAAGLIRITIAGHKFNTGNNVTIAAVGGTTEANGNWVINKVNSSTFDLVGSTFTNAYTSGGTATRH